VSDRGLRHRLLVERFGSWSYACASASSRAIRRAIDVYPHLVDVLLFDDGDSRVRRSNSRFAYKNARLSTATHV